MNYAHHITRTEQEQALETLGANFCNTELRRALGIAKPRPAAKPRKPPQRAEEREKTKAEYEDALASAGSIEASAGPTLRKEIEKPKRFQHAFGVDRSRKTAKVQRLAHRKGLLALLQCETHQESPHELNSRSRLYLDHMLRISANVAVLDRSDWDGALSWFEKKVPALVIQLGADELRMDFERYVSDAAMVLAGRVQGGPQTFMTGPTPREIAQDLQITLAQLRNAEANQCGLTSIDREDRATRDRKRKEQERRAKGMKRQAERTKTAELKQLAEQHGVSLRTFQRKAKKGTLTAYIDGLEQRVANLSAVKEVLPVDTFATPPAADNDNAPHVTAETEVAGYQGRHLTLPAHQVRHIIERHPILADDLKAHLDAIDDLMRKTPMRNHRAVLKNLLRDCNYAAHRQAKLALAA